jgi:two-component system copper resistance phosphate regulon response regulator CusR
MKILLIEDEQKVADFIKKGLEEQEFEVTVAYDGFTGRKIAVEKDFSLLIVDIMLPHFNGLEVCQYIREFKKEVPIIILTALGTVNDKVSGFETGADDYLTKPFHFEELLARIKALLRRQMNTAQGKMYIVEDLVIDCYKREVKRGGREIILTAKEFTLLEVLIANKNRVLSRSHIAEVVWGVNFDRGTNLIDVYINYLRTKIDKDFPKKLIHTVIGMGYMIKD